MTSVRHDVRPRDLESYERLSQALEDYERANGALPGIAPSENRVALLRQMIDSLHRVQYTAVIRGRPLSNEVTDPHSVAFDPIKSAVVHHRVGDLDEAFWLVFLFVHFGKHLRGGWRYLREVYAGDGINRRWTWVAVSTEPNAFGDWLRRNASRIGRKTEPGGFGNHRKYESLDADKANGTAAVVSSYIQWVRPPRTHAEFFASVLSGEGGDPKLAFEALWKSMAVVHRFGRTARFDYLAMLGKLGLVDIVPDKAYLRDASGPRKGAQLLFVGKLQPRLGSPELEERLAKLDVKLGVGMQVLEDSLCNWQKHPSCYVAFRG